MQREDAAALDNIVQGRMVDIRDALLGLYDGIGWAALEFDGWTSYLAARDVPVDMIRVSADRRRPVVAELVEWGWKRQRIADALGVSQSLVGNDLFAITSAGNGEERGGTTAAKRRERERKLGVLSGYLAENPAATLQPTAQALGWSNSVIHSLAQELGHQFPGSKGRTHRPSSIPGSGGAVPVDAPVYTRSEELHDLTRIGNIIGVLRERNGKTKIAQDITEAIKVGDQATVDKYAAIAADARDYLRDIARIFEDDEWRRLLDDGWQGRDDVDIEASRGKRLRAV